MSRFTELEREELSESQRKTYDRLASGSRQGVRGPFIAWLRSPELADRAEAMGNYLRFESILPTNIKELAVLMVAKKWHAAFVWDSHKSLALDAGIANGAIEAIRVGNDPHFDDGEVRSAYSLLSELLNDRAISDGTWNEAIDQLGEKSAVDLLGMTGYYSMVAITIIAMKLRGDAGTTFGSDRNDPSSSTDLSNHPDHIHPRGDWIDFGMA